MERSKRSQYCAGRFVTAVTTIVLQQKCILSKNVDLNNEIMLFHEGNEAFPKMTRRSLMDREHECQRIFLGQFDVKYHKRVRIRTTDYDRPATLLGCMIPMSISSLRRR